LHREQVPYILHVRVRCDEFVCKGKKGLLSQALLTACDLRFDYWQPVNASVFAVMLPPEVTVSGVTPSLCTEVINSAGEHVAVEADPGVNA
jgi:hypothetical protein